MTGPQPKPEYIEVSPVCFAPVAVARDGDAERYAARLSPTDAAHFLKGCGELYREFELDRMRRSYGDKHNNEVIARMKGK